MSRPPISGDPAYLVAPPFIYSPDAQVLSVTLDNWTTARSECSRMTADQSARSSRVPREEGRTSSRRFRTGLSSFATEARGSTRLCDPASFGELVAVGAGGEVGP